VSRWRAIITVIIVNRSVAGDGAAGHRQGWIPIAVPVAVGIEGEQGSLVDAIDTVVVLAIAQLRSAGIGQGLKIITVVAVAHITSRGAAGLRLELTTTVAICVTVSKEGSEHALVDLTITVVVDAVTALGKPRRLQSRSIVTVACAGGHSVAIGIGQVQGGVEIITVDILRVAIPVTVGRRWGCLSGVVIVSSGVVVIVSSGVVIIVSSGVVVIIVSSGVVVIIGRRVVVIGHWDVTDDATCRTHQAQKKKPTQSALLNEHTQPPSPTTATAYNTLTI